MSGSEFLVKLIERTQLTDDLFTPGVRVTGRGHDLRFNATHGPVNLDQFGTVVADREAGTAGLDEIRLLHRVEAHGFSLGDTADQLTQRHQQWPLRGFVDENFIHLAAEPYTGLDRE